MIYRPILDERFVGFHLESLLVLVIIWLQVTEQVVDEKLGRIVTRVVLPRVVMHSRHHYGVSVYILCLKL